MAKNPYTGMAIKELGQVYTTTLLNYGKISGDLLAEINRRGGETEFAEQLRKDKVLDAEKARITKEVAALMGSRNEPALAKTLIHSDLIPEDELSGFIDKVYSKLSADKYNMTIDGATVGGSFTGMLIATFIGFVISAAQIILLGNFIFFTLIITFIISLIIIRLITKKNAGKLFFYVRLLQLSQGL
jgi:hypothetical protein